MSTLRNLNVAAGEPIDEVLCKRLLKAYRRAVLLPATLYEHETSTDAGHVSELASAGAILQSA